MKMRGAREKGFLKNFREAALSKPEFISFLTLACQQNFIVGCGKVFKFPFRMEKF